MSASGDGSGVTAGASGWSNPRLEHLATAFSGHPSSIPQAWVGGESCRGEGRLLSQGLGVSMWSQAGFQLSGD